MITGSSAAGEAIAPCFQFLSKATDQCNTKLPIEVIKDMKGVLGWFGVDKVEECPCTLGSNEKGGMNDQKFDNLDHLYTGVADTEGHWVILKVDSGLGQVAC